jgi:hypothetical protein
MIQETFTYDSVDFSPGDEVKVPGFPGTWFIKEFCRNPRDTNGEWMASLADEKRRLFWPAHHMTKV